jgi:SHS2 domain-containing protein
MVTNKDFEIIDFTSDVGIRAYGKDIPELFVNSARGMFFLICEACGKKDLDADVAKEISLKIDGAISYEDLLISWLEKLLFYHEVDEILFFDFCLEELVLNSDDIKKTPFSKLKAHAYGQYIDLKKHEILVHIKGPTYHDLKIMQDDDNGGVFSVNIIFDI